MARVFANNEYELLSISSDGETWISLDSLLSDRYTRLKSTVIFDFSGTSNGTSKAPFLTFNTNTTPLPPTPLLPTPLPWDFYLFRPAGVFRSDTHNTPANRRFYYNQNLVNNPASDIEKTSNGGTGQYAYVSMYIVATGTDENYSQIFSRPTFIGIYQLPE